MAESLRNRFAGRVEVRLVDGGRGIFDVKADGEMVFSKHAQGRFPNPGEVEDAIATRLS